MLAARSPAWRRQPVRADAPSIEAIRQRQLTPFPCDVVLTVTVTLTLR